MPSQQIASIPEERPLHSEDEVLETFEQEIEEVSQDGGNIRNEPNIFPKEALDLLESRWPAWKEAEKEKRKSVWKTLKKELKVLPCHTGVRGDAWRIKANVSKFNPLTDI